MRSSTVLTRVARAAVPSVVVSLLCASAVAAPSVEEPDLQTDARAAAALLVERCGSCHGPTSDQPKAVRFWADASDLSATLLDGELLVPGDPDSSDVYITIDDMEMPPEDSDIPQLNAEEQALIARWIQAGAHLPEEEEEEAAPEQLPPAETAPDEAAPAATKLPERKDSWMREPWPKWIGRFHPTLVHFPIALLMAALLAEVFAKLFKKPQLQPAATFCYTLGALSSVPSAACGWLLAESTSHRGDDLFYHRWVGVAVVAVSLAGLRLFYTRPKARLPLLLLLAALAGITGHLGGSLSYGSDWLSPPFK